MISCNAHPTYWLRLSIIIVLMTTVMITVIIHVMSSRQRQQLRILERELASVNRALAVEREFKTHRDESIDRTIQRQFKVSARLPC